MSHALRDIQMRDPFLLVEDGTYYLFGSTDPDIWRAPGVGFDVYRGTAPGVFTRFEGPFPAPQKIDVPCRWCKVGAGAGALLILLAL